MVDKYVNFVLLVIYKHVKRKDEFRIRSDCVDTFGKKGNNQTKLTIMHMNGSLKTITWK